MPNQHENMVQNFVHLVLLQLPDVPLPAGKDMNVKAKECGV